MKTNKSGKQPRKRRAAPRPRAAGTKRTGKGNVMLTTLAVGAAGVLGFFTWYYLRKRKGTAAIPDINTILNPLPGPSGSSSPPSTNISLPAPIPYIPARVASSSGSAKAGTNPAADAFPLKKGSKGPNVKGLQQALIAKYGAGVLPKFGADGDFGSETVAALKKAGLPAIIDETNYHVIVQGVATNKAGIGRKIYAAAIKKDLTTVISLLKSLTSKDDYRKASEEFMESRINGVRQTLVNGLLNLFTVEAQKQIIRLEFVRMGLKYDGSKWSLDGFDGRPIVSTEPTVVWVNAKDSISVPAMMVLGAEVTRRLDYTLFENNARYFLVATKSVKYL